MLDDDREEGERMKSLKRKIKEVVEEEKGGVVEKEDQA